MIKHIMLAKLIDNSPENLKKTKEILMSMAGKVPQIIEIKVGTDVLHSERSYDVALEVTVADRQALDDYQSDEYHCGVVKKYMRQARTASVIVDYEI